MRADTFYASGGRKLFYSSHSPLYSIDSVFVDGASLGYADFCYDLVSGWLSLAQAPSVSVVIYYQYSFKNDLTVANWDTHNMAFGNTNAPFIDMHADISLGWAPLTVQFMDNSAGATEWLWRFGDGDSSLMHNPIHTFTTGGAYDIYLQNLLSDGHHNRTVRKMVMVLADTIYIPDRLYPSGGDILTMSVYLKNTHPMARMKLPLCYEGELDLTYVGFDTDSCRTDYFDNVAAIGFNPSTDQVAFQFEAGVSSGNPPLEPGDGPVINIHFTYPSGMGSNTLDTSTFSTHTYNLEAGYCSYQPFVVPGQIQVGLCGDIVGDGTVGDIADLVYMVNYFFNFGPSPPVPEAANMNGQSGINIADLIYLVDYMFHDGPAPDCP